MAIHLYSKATEPRGKYSPTIQVYCGRAVKMDGNTVERERRHINIEKGYYTEADICKHCKTRVDNMERAWARNAFDKGITVEQMQADWRAAGMIF